MGEEKNMQFYEPKPHEKKIRLDLWDTAGQEEFDRIRPLSYRNANYFILCFAVNSQTSFESITQKWVPEIKHHAPGRGFMLVALKSDLECVIDKSKINEIKVEIGADDYIEVSALKGNNVDTVFETAMRHYFKPKKGNNKKKNCILL